MLELLPRFLLFGIGNPMLKGNRHVLQLLHRGESHRLGELAS
jgi:hypothetical protein